MRHEALTLLRRRLFNPFTELGHITGEVVPARVGLLKALLRTFVVFLEQFEHGFVRVQEHLVLLDVHVLGVY